LTGSGPLLYGVTIGGGLAEQGTIFQFNISNDALTLLHSFATGDGGPVGALTLSNGVLYGMTERGGANGRGTIYSYNLGSGAFADLHVFQGGSFDGDEPEGSLLPAGSELYGLTPFGGSSNQGTIFQFNPSNDSFQILHSFTGVGGDGEEPSGSLIPANSTLYGTAFGGTGGDGMLFALSVPEPTSLALCSMATLSLCRRRRSNDRKRYEITRSAQYSDWQPVPVRS
jgi:uncharacterized repeat protein (TIGR03803 family)